MPRLLITGGRQRAPGLRAFKEWHQYDLARAAVLDTDTGRVDVVFEHETPAANRPAEEPSHVFKAGDPDGDRFLMCTQTEVLVVDPTTWTVESTISHPWMNDVHHAKRVGDKLYVVSTGLDAVLVFDNAGELLSYVSVVDEDRREAFPAGTDFRKLHTTKPHVCHPNYIHETSGQLWVTRFAFRDVCRLDDPTAKVDLPGERLHDGIVHDGSVWLTQIDGALVELDAATHAVKRRIDLAPITPLEGPLGWCRSLHVDGSIAYVGFSRLRRTKVRENLSWLKGRLTGGTDNVFSHPTRVAAYDVDKGEMLEMWSLEEAGVNAVFSILPL